MVTGTGELEAVKIFIVSLLCVNEFEKKDRAMLDSFNH